MKWIWNLRLIGTAAGIAFFLGLAAMPLPAEEAEKEPVALPLDEALTPAVLWTAQPADFVESQKALGFRWISASQDTAQTTRKGNTLFGLPVTQTILRADKEKIGRATVLFYNRGDDGEIPRQEFEKQVRCSIEGISAALGKFTPRGRDASNAVKADGVFWNTADAVYLLEYSFTREDRSRQVSYRAEFVRLEITPREAPKSLLAEAREAREKATPFRGVDHVERDAASGDVWIKDLPMVDQGEKGYCVVASVERVLRYYGVRVDSNELAQLADSSASEGTSVRAMTESLKRLTARFKIRVRTVIEFNFQAFKGMVADYNRAAKRAKGTEVVIPEGMMIELKDIYAQMTPDLLREVRTKSKAALSGFEGKVKANIDKGVPLLWSVMYGVIPESSKNQGLGGHMRLIIGYNEKTREILYSDSWGMGHELKRMPSADAWSMTTNLATIEPF